MEMEELEITIPRDGTVRINVKGICGTGCIEATKGLEEAAGTVIHRNFTAAYYEQEARVRKDNVLSCRNEG